MINFFNTYPQSGLHIFAFGAAAWYLVLELLGYNSMAVWAFGWASDVLDPITWSVLVMASCAAFLIGFWQRIWPLAIAGTAGHMAINASLAVLSLGAPEPSPFTVFLVGLTAVLVGCLIKNLRDRKANDRR